jgi:hypothetical protein
MNKRTVFMVASFIDLLLSGAVLLVYFGFFPVDISGWGISRRVLGVVGGLWFVISVAVLAYQWTRTDVNE